MNNFLAQQTDYYSTTPPGYDSAIWNDNWATFWHNFAHISGLLLPWLVMLLVLIAAITIAAMKADNNMHRLNSEGDDDGN